MIQKLFYYKIVIGIFLFIIMVVGITTAADTSKILINCPPQGNAFPADYKVSAEQFQTGCWYILGPRPASCTGTWSLKGSNGLDCTEREWNGDKKQFEGGCCAESDLVNTENSRNPIVCEAGFTYDTQKKSCVPTNNGGCYPGSYWDSASNACVSDSCPSGTTWSDADGACVAWIQGKCPIGYHEDGSGSCVVDSLPQGCYPGSQWDSAEQACVAIGGCPSGTEWSPADGACVHTSTLDCPSGTYYDPTQDSCISTDTPGCPTGSEYYAPEQACISCGEGYKLDSASGDCVPDCPIKGGSVEVSSHLGCTSIPEGSPPVCEYGGDATGTGGVEFVQKYWDFGDGTYSNELSGTKKFTEPGNFQPKFIFIDQCGNEESDTPKGGPVTVEKPCSVSGSWEWRSTASCVPNSDGSQKCEIKSTVKETGDLKIKSLKLDYGDGSTPQEIRNEATTSHTFTKPGCYTLKMAITDQCGKVQTSSYTGDPICVCEKGLIYDDSQKKCIPPPTIVTPTPKKTPPKVIVIHVTPVIQQVTNLQVIEKQTRPPKVTITPKKFVVITKVSTKTVKDVTKPPVIAKTQKLQTKTLGTQIKTPTQKRETVIPTVINGGTHMRTFMPTKAPVTSNTPAPATKTPTPVIATIQPTPVIIEQTPTVQPTIKKYRVITKVVTKIVRDSNTLKSVTQTLKVITQTIKVKTQTQIPVKAGTKTVITPKKTDITINVTKESLDDILRDSLIKM